MSSAAGPHVDQPVNFPAVAARHDEWLQAAPLPVSGDRAQLVPDLVEFAEILDHMFRLYRRFPCADGTGNQAQLVGGEAGLGPISRAQRCIRSITLCLYLNLASMLQRAIIMVVLLG